MPLSVFRCDASPEIGGGHAVRCLVLADALAEAGWRCVMATNAEAANTVPALFAGNHELLTLTPQDGETEARALGEALGEPADLLVVDHYGLDARFENAARDWANRILAIDDLADRKHNCDVLLDASTGREEEAYRALLPIGAVCLAGPRYALLRPGFRRARMRLLTARGPERPVRRLLISFGAADGKAVTPVALEAVASANLEAEIDVVLGAAAAQHNGVAALTCRLESTVTVHRAVADMAALMERADLCIGAAGVSALERCCTGLPSLVVSTADNQAAQAAALAAAGAIVLAGTAPLQDPQTLAQLLRRLADDGEARAQMATRALSVCDGLGARRVVLALEPECDRQGRMVALRPVQPKDSELIFEWQSTPSVRALFENPEPPARIEHEAWFARRQSATDGGLYVIECDGQPAGVLRLDHGSGEETGGKTVSILVTPDCSGAGVGTAALRCARRLHAEEELFAQIHPDNGPSRSAFLRAGFRPESPGRYRGAPMRAASTHRGFQ